MGNEKIFKEFPTEKMALNSYNEYVVSKCEISNGDKNYTGLTIGKYFVMYPVLIYKTFSSFKKGWMCRILDKGKYKIVLNLNLSKLYFDNNSDSVYFGVKYVSGDLVYSKLNEKQFKEEYVNETLKIKKNDEDYINQEKCDKAIENLHRNLNFFVSLDDSAFNKELSRIAQKYHFKEVNDISSYKNCLYILVIDEYKQFYVGKCVGGLKNRTRKHWNAKIIPYRQFWDGGCMYSRLKIDNFKMLDTTRIFVSDEIEQIILENKEIAENPKLEKANTFDYTYYENMTSLDKAERIVINDCLCKFCLSDRTPLLLCPCYDKLETKYGINRDNLQIKHYLGVEEYKI